MINRILLIALGVLMFSAAGLTAEESVFPYDYEVKTLDNGLTLITVPMPSNGIVSYYTLVRTGARDEYEEGRTGFAHFFEHMMFRGTKKYPGPVYDSLVTSIGADGGAYTSDDYTAYYMNFTKEDLDMVIELQSDRFQNLSYKEPEFKTEAGAVYGEYRKNLTNPIRLLLRDLKAASFMEHTYGHTAMGYEEDIKIMPELYEYSKEFYSRFYRPENCIVMVAGDIKHDEVYHKIEHYYSSWEKGYVKPDIPEEPEQKGEIIDSSKFPGKTNPLIAVSYKTRAFDPANKIVVATQLLGKLAFGQNSEIYKKLYLEEQKVQSLGSYFPESRDPYISLVYSMISKEKDIDYVKNEIIKTVEHYQNNLVDEKKLNDLKSREKYSFLMNLDTPSSVTGNLARIVSVTGKMESAEQYFSTMDKITPSDIQAAAKELTKDKRTVIILTGDK